MFVLRDVRPDDLDELERLAHHLNTLNLPADRQKLAATIAESQESFAGERPHHARQYVFVMEDTAAGRLIGTSMIIAQHGSFERPTVYFEVRQEQKYSQTLARYFVHQVLQLSFNYDGPTEIGGLILDPAYQGHGMKLGKLLSFMRFLFIGRRRDWFRDAIIAELLPELNPDGTSDLWECLGANFTELEYREADQLSRQNVEFIRSLFPQTPIYTALLPAHVREKIGVVGGPTRPVEKMLRSVGFEWDRSIDPFDGGPTFVCPTEECRLIQRTHEGMFAGSFQDAEEAEGEALVSVERPGARGFQATIARYRRAPRGYELHAPVAQALGLQPRETLGMLVLSGREIDDLWRGRWEDQGGEE
ncbi:arginine N-succinyltransferase [Lujinxingia litoralis]|uniref:Arginine N-succinyltransferase n=1 Tax=Lujinxingia litoralis TaxID=2211119 RepID=A0A328C4K3_9DELT|nr:arginine N-succinyltransferase [Lujinxingia litoralis]RAL22189.1 arginine N-succinyltransferase [Lujinxingia litoralis]